ncbi:hypothetical protein F2Q69_00041212 [Brassica cretica]|uniref:Uncharacterized protein n=1 Tax=Brassica cretica TaxID=69181 RepID=A0A8S9NFF4_BRACR|nr:hypothetical protein F2Q69_00041212 [Brassica cretica]
MLKKDSFSSSTLSSFFYQLQTCLLRKLNRRKLQDPQACQTQNLEPLLRDQPVAPPVVHRTPPARVRTNTSPVRPVTYAQFDSEEELISAAQSILRKRIAAAEAELPPFSTAKDRRRVRQHQRQAMLKLCNNLDVSSSTSDIPTVFQREASPNEKSPPILEA